jgi:pyridinium-3,5-bisthiocarboxylic acid mononucleotide nickel chelatase
MLARGGCVTLVHIDPITGTSEHMLLGALLDAGVAHDEVLEVLERLPVSGWEIEVNEVTRGGVGATRVEITSDADEVVRTWSNIRDLLGQAPLPAAVRDRSISSFRRLAEAEARIHRIDTERAHFHEVDVLGSLVCVVAVCTAFHLLRTQHVTCGPVPQGIGVTRTPRGLVPVPAPTVMELLEGAPTFSVGLQSELCTPTGAALLAEWADAWTELPPMTLLRTGYGAGAAELERPNLLRVLIGKVGLAGAVTTSLQLEAVVPELASDELDELLTALEAAGAEDAWVRATLRRAGARGFELVCQTSLDAAEAVRSALADHVPAPRVTAHMVERRTETTELAEAPQQRPNRSRPRPPTTA